MTPKNTDYEISTDAASWLKGAVLLPYEFRVMALEKYAAQIGDKAVIKLFAQFIGLANSVVENCRDATKGWAVQEGLIHPDRNLMLNMPDIFGALNGVGLANSVNQEKLCEGCAYRHGTLANQSPSTTCDVQWQQGDDDDFHCHKNLNEKGEPTRKCVGHQRYRKNR